MQVEYEKYICNKSTLRQTLDEYGVAIIPNVIDNDECEEMRDSMWSFFEHITQKWNKPIKRNRVNTWRGIYDLFPLHSQLFQHWNIGHAQVSWNLRQNPKIVDIFAKLWNCEQDELLTSFDGLSMCLPPEKTNKGWQNKNWFHTDQSYTRNNIECIQSWITANDINDGDASLLIYEGSHKFHRDFAVQYDKHGKDDWYKLNAEEEKFYSDRCLQRKIVCPAGSLVLWDSRTIHYGSNPIKGRSVENIRQIVYLCYTPRYMCDNIGKKINYFETLRTCNHWPHKPKAFPLNPRTYGAELPSITPIKAPVLSELGMKLVGY